MVAAEMEAMVASEVTTTSTGKAVAQVHVVSFPEVVIAEVLPVRRTVIARMAVILQQIHTPEAQLFTHHVS